MIIPTTEEIAKAYEAILQRGPGAPETEALALLAVRDEIIRAVVEKDTKVMSKMLGLKEDTVLLGLVLGVYITGLNWGLTAAEVRFNRA